MTNQEKMNNLTERRQHYESMHFPINDAQLLEDMEQHIAGLSDAERKFWLAQEFYEGE